MHRLTPLSDDLVLGHLARRPDPADRYALLAWVQGVCRDPRGRADYDLGRNAFFAIVPGTRTEVTYVVNDDRGTVELLRID